MGFPTDVAAAAAVFAFVANSQLGAKMGHSLARSLCRTHAQSAFAAADGQNVRLYEKEEDVEVERNSRLSKANYRLLGGNSMALRKGPKIRGPFSVPFSGALFVLLNQD